jgi:hypothetical protein
MQCIAGTQLGGKILDEQLGQFVIGGFGQKHFEGIAYQLVELQQCSVPGSIVANFASILALVASCSINGARKLVSK